jgi:AraC-like DNA-binding protein
LRAKAVMDTCFADALDVHTLARVALMSRAHFTREFHRQVGAPPHRYLMRRRMEQAAMLLRESDLPVNEICRRVGLRSVGSFTTRFKTVFGCSPAAYRTCHRRPR